MKIYTAKFENFQIPEIHETWLERKQIIEYSSWLNLLFLDIKVRRLGFDTLGKGRPFSLS